MDVGHPLPTADTELLAGRAARSRTARELGGVGLLGDMLTLSSGMPPADRAEVGSSLAPPSVFAHGVGALSSTLVEAQAAAAAFSSSMPSAGLEHAHGLPDFDFSFLFPAPQM